MMAWDEINNKRLPFIRMGERLFKGMYSEIKKSLIASFENLTTPEEIVQAAKDFKINEEPVRAAFEKFYLKVGIAFAKSMVKSSRGRIETKQEDEWIRTLIEYVRVNTGLKISKTISTHYEDIDRIVRAVVEQGIKEGCGIDKIARAIRNTQGEMDLWKALRIARTEVVAASNEGVKIGAEDLPGNKEKVWVSTFDERARPDHMAMDGTTVAFNENFTLPSGVVVEFPGDPKCTDPGEIINCRCGYEIVVSSEYF
jgi:uncharacterized protein with gpF-like domain